VVLRLQDQNGKDLGQINWFAVHGTSMNNTNLLISGDNKGYASYIFEKRINGLNSKPGVGPFVAAFGQRFFFSFAFSFHYDARKFKSIPFTFSFFLSILFYVSIQTK
jgi:hypothetical protein